GASSAAASDSMNSRISKARGMRTCSSRSRRSPRSCSSTSAKSKSRSIPREPNCLRSATSVSGLDWTTNCSAAGTRSPSAVSRLRAGERTLRAAWLAMCRRPHGHMSLLEATAEYLDAPEIVIVREVAETGRWQHELRKLYAPHRLVFSIPASLERLDAALADKKAGASSRAYVCRGSTCSAPVESLADLVRTAQARVAN